ncbi:hypothetical protein H9N25_19565 [Pedobacter riviphilus]|uniref:Uncharacterized protein n=1 Tax=Pedobacter riviphilus TaxID=2766984 RepID=A0ABX6TF07_9SPHI|nr:DUF6804 family protein [Pedobacter riviphilus]QNR84089.1 hypothetical protein H9N25_19565 [Pedobacter riviphilus]
MKALIKIVLAMLLLICLANMPYGYYQLVRFLAMVGFGILAHRANQKRNPIIMITYLALAVLFQPIFKIALGRFLWNVVDVIVALGLIISIYLEPKTNTDKKNHLN